MIELEAVVSTAADSAQAEILTPEIDTVVWEEVSARTSDDSTLSVSFGVLMVLAGIIAAIAVLTNNPVLIVGATIVSPDYGPMAALSVAVVNRAAGQAWKSFRALAMGSLSEAGKSLLILLVNLAGLAGWWGVDPARDPGVGTPDRGRASDHPAQAKARPLTGRPNRWLDPGRRACPASARGPGQQG